MTIATTAPADTAVALPDAPVTLAAPSIDRYFPQCWGAVVEAVSKLLFGVRDFGKLYGRHTFSYRRPPGAIRYRSNGVELDVELHRAPMPEDELPRLIEELYGIRTRELRVTSVDEYLDFCRRELARGVPIITGFDLGFIKARREYAKLFGLHVIAVYGYEPSRRQFSASEQMLGSIRLDLADVAGCIERRTSTEGGMALWQLERAEHGERELSRAEVLARVEANVQNLSAEDPCLGLAGLAAFRADLAEYLRGEGFEQRPFSVPGLWVFSHERHIERKWLSAVRQAYPRASSSSFDEFDVLLASLFKRWLACDYLIEKCLLSGQGKALRSLVGHLDGILLEESRALELWSELQRLLANAT